MDATFFQRAIEVCSYSWNGAVNAYADGNKPFKITAFKPDYILQWEINEADAHNFNDCVNKPSPDDGGISARHKSAVLGLFGGSTEFMKPADFNALGASAAFNRAWCNPGNPATGH